MNWSLSYIFLGVFLESSSVLSAPTKIESLYDVIATKCPKVKEMSSFSKQPLFKTCSNWNEISKITELNNNQFLCLLFHDAFISYCSNTKSINTTLSTEIFTKYKLEQICEKMALVPKDSQFKLQTIIKTEENCKSICMDEFTGFPTPICVMSYYFVHLPLTSIPIKENTPNDDNSLGYAVQDLSDAQKNEAENVETITNVKNNQDLPLPNDSKMEPSNKSNQNNNKPQIQPKKPDEQLQQEQQQQPEHPQQNQKQPQVQPETQKQLKPKQQEQNVKADTDKTVLEHNPQQDPIKTKDTPSVAVDNIPNIPEDKADDKNKPEINEGNNKPVEDDVEKPPVISDVNNDVEIQPQDNVNADKPQLEEQEEFAEEDLENSNKNLINKMPENSKPNTIDESINFSSEMNGDSYFFSYFMVLCLLFIMGYVGYHNKQKILAIILEGRRGRRQYRGRRPNSANYHKLDSNLEEAISSSCNKNTTNVIY